MTSLTRLPDWQLRLAAVTTRCLETPSEWGSSDCILKAADAVEAVTGVDLAAEFRGAYSTETGAAKILRQRGCENVEQLLDQMFEPVGRLMAQRGDLVSIEEDGAIAAGFVTEYGVCVATPRGSAFRPQTSLAIRKAYRVGR
ncbi:MAG: hypothetical protein KF810_02960 [Rhizobiaceae bacterium]|nr:hypothetical protein [Rhizobiaceae bacterium]